jgi:hypothetical protein
MTTQHKFDIFAVIGNITSKQESFVDNLSEEDLKQIQPLVLMRWLSGTSSRFQTFLLNEVANVLVFPLTKHKKLLLKVLMACSDPKSGRCSWLKQEQKTVSRPISIKVVCDYFQYPRRKAIDALPLISADDLVAMANELGYQHDEITKLQREHKTPRGKTTKDTSS